ncbi:MAG: Hpt domain-containing protein [Acidobacteriota bacterium]|nr:Hpt domain-containing protein [Acidobacteriota bacterium]
MDPDDYRESAALFVKLAPELTRELRALAGAGNLQQLRMLAHRLVGTVGFFDAEASDCARRLEAGIVAGRVSELPALAGALEGELAVLVRRLTDSGFRPTMEVHGERSA